MCVSARMCMSVCICVCIYIQDEDTGLQIHSGKSVCIDQAKEIVNYSLCFPASISF